MKESNIQKLLKNEKAVLLLICTAALFVMGVFCVLRKDMRFTQYPKGTYETLAPDTSFDDPLAYLGEDFEVKEGFHTNLPIVIMQVDSEFPDYKTFDHEHDVAILTEGVDPYTTGVLEIIDTGSGFNSPNDAVVYKSDMKIKMKGHSSYHYDKKQYRIETINADGTNNNADILGMGIGNDWVLNGSMADKSMMRNYLAYRIASEIDGNNMAPDSRFCEVMTRKDGKLYYEGVFLLMETVSQGDDRVNIDKYNSKNVYSSYIVRRDRYTTTDIMLETYGRVSGLANDKNTNELDNWIGLRYPSQAKVTPETVSYIESDFSNIEKVIYSDDESLFRVYDRYIDMDSFVDYFLINEFFGNYDAGEHSTFMHKNSGDLLYMGPVWDYDQAMNNDKTQEAEAEHIAFQTQTMFKQLCNDKRYVKALKKRYTSLRANQLSEEHVFQVIDAITF